MDIWTLTSAIVGINLALSTKLTSHIVLCEQTGSRTLRLRIRSAEGYR